MLDNFLKHILYTSKDGSLVIKVFDIIIILVAYITTLIILKIVFRIIMRRLEKEDKPKVKLIFNFIFKLFDEGGIKTLFPQRDLHIIK